MTRSPCCCVVGWTCPAGGGGDGAPCPLRAVQEPSEVFPHRGAGSGLGARRPGRREEGRARPPTWGQIGASRNRVTHSDQGQGMSQTWDGQRSHQVGTPGKMATLAPALGPPGHSPAGERRGQKAAAALEASVFSLPRNRGVGGLQGLDLSAFMPAAPGFTPGCASWPGLQMPQVDSLQVGGGCTSTPGATRIKCHNHAGFKQHRCNLSPTGRGAGSCWRP